MNVKIVGDDQLLGRDTYVIEAGPIYQGQQSSTDGSSGETNSGTMRLWVDKQFLFTLRLQMPAGPEENDGTVSLEYTNIEFNGDVAADKFQFSPPSGATEVAATERTNGSQTVTAGNMPTGFLSPSYRPDGYIGAATGSSSDTAGTLIEAYTRLTRGDGYLLLRERIRKDGLPNTIMQGTVVDVNGHNGWFQDASGARSVIWLDGDIAVQLTANQLSDDELLHVARSMSR